METLLAYHKNDNDYQYCGNYRIVSVLYQGTQMTIDNKLTLLACSGSILATTLFGMPSEALPAPSLNNRAPQLAAAPLSRSKAVRPTHSEEMLTPKGYDRRLQQAAIGRFGCGCASCVTSIRELVRAGQISV
jgi:hypothetical protein